MTQAEKLVKIIMPDLLRYLKLKERGLVCQNRVLQRIPLDQREKKKINLKNLRKKSIKSQPSKIFIVFLVI